MKWEQEIANQWFRDEGNTKLRLNYNLNKDSIVFDIGGYTGEGAQRLYDTFGCQIYSFEPVPEFYKVLEDRFKDVDAVKTFPFGLGHKNETLKISVDSDATSTLIRGDTEISIVNIGDFLDGFHIENIDLLEMNVEGAEYDLLDFMIREGYTDRVENLTIQFHDTIPDAADRMLAIQSKLKNTHELTYQYIFIFENWRKK